MLSSGRPDDDIGQSELESMYMYTTFHLNHLDSIQLMIILEYTSGQDRAEIFSPLSPAELPGER
jgi:hypothetical protein